MPRRVVVIVKYVRERNTDSRRCPGLGKNSIYLEFLYWGGCKGEEVQVDGAFTRNISNHNDLAHRSASNEIREPGERGSDCS